jgi:hypothetical protein
MDTYNVTYYDLGTVKVQAVSQKEAEDKADKRMREIIKPEVLEEIGLEIAAIEKE